MMRAAAILATIARGDTRMPRDPEPPPERQDAPLEHELAALLRDQQYDQLATRALEAYSDGLYGYLISLMKNPMDAAEVFSQAVEDFWRGLPRFRGEARVQTWLYKLAQHAACRFRRSPWNRGDRTSDSKIDDLVAAYSHTAPWRDTEVKDHIRTLRDDLDPDDRALLILRVDRDLGWKDVALVMLEHDQPTAAAIDREAARLRKRFEHVKKQLRARVATAGLVDP
jgi:RNA polymerase sigma-70 factor (ECF subfamily)